jgi:hypothetical protein
VVRIFIDTVDGWIGGGTSTATCHPAKPAPCHLVGRFPFAVVYREIAEDEVEIAAVAHLKGRHAYWSKR